MPAPKAFPLSETPFQRLCDCPIARDLRIGSPSALPVLCFGRVDRQVGHPCRARRRCLAARLMTARVLPRGHPGPSQAASTCDPSPFSEDEVEKLIRDLHFGAEAKEAQKDEPGAHQMWLHLLVALTGLRGPPDRPGPASVDLLCDMCRTHLPVLASAYDEAARDAVAGLQTPTPSGPRPADTLTYADLLSDPVLGRELLPDPTSPDAASLDPWGLPPGPGECRTDASQGRGFDGGSDRGGHRVAPDSAPAPGAVRVPPWVAAEEARAAQGQGPASTGQVAAKRPAPDASIGRPGKRPTADGAGNSAGPWGPAGRGGGDMGPRGTWEGPGSGNSDEGGERAMMPGIEGDTPEASRTAYASMFRTATAQLREDAKRNPASSGRPVAELGGGTGAAVAGRGPYGGLGKARGGRRLGMGAGAGSVRGGFIPPFVRKGMEDGDGGGGGRGDAGAKGAGREGDGRLSPKTLALLGVPEGGEVPESIARLDPEIVEAVCSEVVEGRATVTWEDIAGQEHAKRLIQEMVVWPMLNPHLFTGARAPPRGILLFGPPGTGKTLLGKAIATNIHATFFSISASSLTSKWIGQGEKLVRALFAVAGVVQPSVIFIDEIDSILSARKADGEHEASRRLKTEILVQMEGIDPSSDQRRVHIIGATNRPEELDEAARRRLPKQLYIPLPCALARRDMVLRQLSPDRGAVASDLSGPDLDKLVARTEGYSGSDMKNLIQEACQGPVRDAVARLGARIADLSPSDLRPVVLKDFQIAARAQKASVAPDEIKRYEEYDARHGAHYAQDGQGDDDGEE